jgi:hypothetical protein
MPPKAMIIPHTPKFKSHQPKKGHSRSRRQRLITANDDLFRKIIRLRDHVCQKTGRAGNLQVAHFWTRGNLRVRWDLDNACLLNAGVHKFWAHVHRKQFEVFWQQRLGKEKFGALEIRARYAAPVSEFALVCINEELKKMLEGIE